MKFPKLFFLLATILFTVTGSGQKIIMKIKGVAPAAGEQIKALEYKIDAESSWVKGGGASVGKPNSSGLLIKKDIGLFTFELTKKIVKGESFAEISFEYFDDKDEKTPYYIITLYEVFVIQNHFLSPECPTCISLENQHGFVFKKIKFDDKKNSKTVIWDISAGTFE